MSFLQFRRFVREINENIEVEVIFFGHLFCGAVFFLWSADCSANIHYFPQNTFHGNEPQLEWVQSNATLELHNSATTPPQKHLPLVYMENAW